MGSVISKAADGAGTLMGNAFVAPFKAVFGGSTCEGVCSGTWDLPCYIEHLCLPNLLKLLMVSALWFTTLLFVYLFFKLGICQCIGRSACKMCWGACATYCLALKEITCFLWRKLMNVQRVSRFQYQYQDSEAGYGSSMQQRHHRRKLQVRPQRSTKDGRVTWGGRRRHYNYQKYSSCRGHVHLKERSAAAGRLKHMRRHQMKKASDLRREALLLERRLSRGY